MEIQRLKSLLGAYREITNVASVESTNTRLVELASQGADDRTVLIADEQTAGQGRRSRDWASPEGGIYLSVLLRPGDVPANRVPWLTLLAGVALVRTARWAGVADAALKWPNDLLLGPDRRKSAGVLAEVTDGAVVLGIGLNVAPLPDDVPLGAGGLAPTSLLSEGATESDQTDIATKLLTELDTLERAWRAAGGDPDASGLRAEYLSCCVTVGQRVRVELPGGTERTGVGTGVGVDGTLVLRGDDDTEWSVSAGDVVHVRAVD